MNNTILITGVAGFIGSNLAKKLLQEGNTVIGIDNFDPFYDKKIKQQNLHDLDVYSSLFKFYEMDIRDKTALETIKENIQVVVHLAAKAGVLPSIKDPSEYMSVNIDGTYAVLEFMRVKGINKMVFASSSSIYGNNKNIPFSEEDRVDAPISPYAFTKKSCELLNHNYHHLYKFDIINLRFFTVYGPGQRPDLAIHKFIKRIEKGESIEMYGEGDSARDYTYIDDTVSGIRKAIHFVLQNDKVYEIINLGNNSPVQLKELIEKICQVLGKKADIIKLPVQPGDVDITYANIEKAKRLLGYHPSITIEQGLKNFVEWIHRVK